MDSPSDGSGCRGRDWGVRPRALRRPGRHPRQRAAAPFLIRHLPQLTDRKLVDAVARHLRGTAEPRAAFPALREAFVGWAPIHPDAPGWTLGDLLAWAAQAKNADDLLELAQDTRYGMARQMIVDSLWRFKKHTQVEPVLIRLMSDPDDAQGARDERASEGGRKRRCTPLDRECSRHRPGRRRAPDRVRPSAQGVEGHRVGPSSRDAPRPSPRRAQTPAPHPGASDRPLIRMRCVLTARRPCRVPGAAQVQVIGEKVSQGLSCRGLGIRLGRMILPCRVHNEVHVRPLT
jgi:hypothetical protein